MNKLNILFLFILFSASNLLAQEQELPSSEKEVLKKFNAKLATANKLKRTFELPVLDNDQTYLSDYKTSDKTVSLDYAKADIKALAIETEVDKEIHKFYLEGAMGLPLNPYGAASYSFNKDQVDIILSGKYLSYDDDSYKNNTDIDINLASNFIVKDMLKLEVGGGYGIMNRGLITNLDSNLYVDRKLNGINTSIGVSNSQETRSEINYSLGYNLETWKDNFDHEQFRHQLKGSLDKQLGTYWSAAVQGDFQYTTFKQDTFESKKETIAGLYPSLLLSKSKYTLEFGTWAGSIADEFTILPNISFTYTINPQSSIHAGLRSGYIQQDFKYSTKINPYLNYESPEIETQTYMSPYLGIQFAKSGYNIDLEASYHLTEKFQHFANDTLQLLAPRFNNVYSDVDFIGIRAQISKRLNNGLDVALVYKHRIVQSNDLDLFHIPIYNASLNVQYNELLDSKLSINSSFDLEGGRKYLSGEGTKTIDPILDLKIHGSYEIGKNVAVYLGIRNALNNKKEQFHQYERIGINPYLGAWIKI